MTRLTRTRLPLSGLLLLLLSSLALLSSACPSPPALTCEAQGTCPLDEVGGPPKMYVSPSFGLAFDCSAIGCHQARTVHIENQGGGVLSVVSVELSEGTSVDFSLQADQTLPVELGAGQFVEFAVLY